MNNKTNHNPGKGFKLSRILLIDTIMCQTGISLKHDSTRFFNHIDKMIGNIGLRQTTLRLKAINHIVLNLALKQPSPGYSRISITKSGMPKEVKYLKKYLTTPQGIQAVISLLSYYRGMIAPGTPDFSTITSPGPLLEEELLTKIAISAKAEYHFSVRHIQPPELLLRSKRGPNGQATVACMLDLKALPENLIESIQKLSELQEGQDFNEILEFAIDDIQDEEGTKPKPSTLAIKREGGGKDRIFAIVDYWSQCALKPLHSQLAHILKTIDNDCTFNQGAGVPCLKKWTKEGTEVLYSIDLKAATDRFPLKLQSRILEKLTGNKEYAKNWANLMANRPFHYKGKTYKWEVGQPLGAYSSWPMFALSHHIVVQYCAQQVGVSPQYFLLGDDIVIRGSKLAKEYLNTLNKLGVEVSLSKSITSKEAVEFAKRIFYRGQEISPAPVKLLDSLLKNPLLITEALQHLGERSSNTDVFKDLRHTAVRAFGDLTKKRKQLVICASNPITGFPEIGGYKSKDLTTVSVHANKWPSFRAETYEMIYLIGKTNSLIREYNKAIGSNTLFRRSLDDLKLPGMAPANRCEHPVYIALQLQEKQLKRGTQELVAIMQAAHATKDMIPRLRAITIEGLMPSYLKRSIVKSNMVLTLHTTCNKIAHLAENTGRTHDTINPEEVINFYRILAKA